MRWRTKAHRPARSSGYKRPPLGASIRSGTMRVQQKFHPSQLLMSKAAAASCYTLLKKKNKKQKPEYL
jgi:hypothetical protein